MNQQRTALTQTTFLLFISFLHFTSVLAQCTDFTLATPSVSNNSNKGVMFNVTAGATAITVTGINMSLILGSTGDYEIYYKAGTYVGSETNAGAWTLAATATAVTSAGLDVLTPIPASLQIVIPAGQTYGFYFTNNNPAVSAGIRYTNSAGYATLASDANMSIAGGIGKAYPYGANYNNRSVNCSIRYTNGDINNANTISATNATTTVANQNSAGTSNYAPSCSQLICKLTGAGASPVSGSVTSRVWIESTQPNTYEKRHYQIMPASNAATATGIVTLYFTQQEFTDFNTLNPSDLPTGAADAAGKANLRIEKREGVSNNGTGLPVTYTGAVIDIDPVDSDIVWNATDSRWEVSFATTGFSGFFVKTTHFTLPLNLNSFVGSRQSGFNLLQWQTAAEVNTASFEIESSSNGAQFTIVASIPAKGSGNNAYNYQHKNPSVQSQYYRLKMIDRDGAFTYSQVIALTSAVAQTRIALYPNPASNSLQLTVTPALLNTRANIVDATGRILQTVLLDKNLVQINLQNFVTGSYMIRFEDGTVERFVKQ